MAGIRASQGVRHRSDPRIDPPSRADRRRLLGWVAFLGFTPICIGVVLWAALDLNGSYPTVRTPVPRGWQAVPGVYASFSAPKSWTLQQAMSDSAGDIYYAGRDGAVGESVTQANKMPPVTGPLPAIVGTFLGGGYRVLAAKPFTLHNATEAWHYRFDLTNGQTGLGTLAWVKATQSVVWLVALPATPTAEKVLSTLSLAA
jgi:hypothetical protein